ncbi:MAG: hypothetical protein ACI9VS_001294 [Candidatus Binatia bacterium]|jgi:hypothetical protein
MGVIFLKVALDLELVKAARGEALGHNRAVAHAFRDKSWNRVVNHPGRSSLGGPL